jgi:uncharacterized protein (UPF0332 family)
MNFDWAGFLTLADALLRDPNLPGPEEASLRSAISRAYYAAFCSARNFARDNEGLVPTGKATDHELARSHFETSGDRARWKIATDLGRLRDNRNRADYDDVLSRPIPLAQSSVAVARSVLNTLKSL